MVLHDERTDWTELRELPGYAVSLAYRSLRHAMDNALRELGLTTPQWVTLKAIAENGGISGADLARMNRCTPQTMNTVLHNLEHGDLIRRERHPAHGTVLVIKLTDAGRQRLAEAHRLVWSVQERMLDGFDAEERSTLLRLLGRCIDALAAEARDAACLPDDE